MRCRGTGFNCLVLGLAAGSAILGPVGRLHAQERVVPGSVTCPTCSVELTPRFTYRPAPGGLAGVPLQVVRWGDGRLLVRIPGHPVIVFAANGRLVGNIGRRGAGPGEFDDVAYMVRLPGDSLLLLDSGLLRASVMGPDFRFIRSVSLPFYANALAVVDWPRSVVVNGASYAASMVGWPLHVLDFSASPARTSFSFGDNNGELRAGQDFALMRRFFGVSGGGFWAHHITKYQLTRYARDGRIEMSIRRRPEWFENDSPWSIGGPNTQPPPMVQAAAIRHDTLWVALGVARPDWQRSWRSERLRGRTEISAAERPDQSELYRTRIEVIDLRNERVVAQRDIEGIVVDIDDQLAMTVYDLGPDSERRLRLFNVRLKR